MTTFVGTYFDGKSSEAFEVAVTVEGNILCIRGQTFSVNIKIADCTVVSALGSTPRTIYTTDGGRLDTTDLKRFAVVEKKIGGASVFRAIHKLERRWIVALVAAIITVLMAFSVGMLGIPYLARVAAFTLPDETMHSLGKEVLTRMDRYFFATSELDKSERKRIEVLVAKLVERAGAINEIELTFRKSSFGPNAFALPGKIVVLTDELVSFVEDDAELLWVVAHELAHLNRRHATQSVLQSSGLVFLVTVFVGDSASFNSTKARFATLLLESRYSRELEREADIIAFGWMRDTGYGVRPMVSFLTRVRDTRKGEQMPEIMSTHPTPENRISELLALAKQKP